jgi:transcriptional regulator NrdR family protein
MKCPGCESENSAVIDSRDSGNRRRRRRRCVVCDYRFTTIEMIADDFAHLHTLPGLQKTLVGALEEIESAIESVKRSQVRVKQVHGRKMPAERVEEVVHSD